MWPDAIKEIWNQLEQMKSGIIGLVGLQGVGKSSALLALEVKFIMKAANGKENSKQKKSEQKQPEDYRVIRFKWRREADLFRSLLEGGHECSEKFDRDYRARLIRILEGRLLSQKRVCLLLRG